MTKFNKTLTFDGSRELEQRGSEAASKNGRETPKRRASSTTKLERERQFIRANQLDGEGGVDQQVLDAQLGATNEFSPSFVGLAGVFIPIQNDFTSVKTQANDGGEDEKDLNCLQSSSAARYRDAAHWPSQKRAKVKRVRFVICLLALTGHALALMSRLMLNVCIVEMVRQPSGNSMLPTEGYEAPTSTQGPELDLNALINDDPLIYAANYGVTEETIGGQPQEDATAAAASSNEFETATEASNYEGKATSSSSSSGDTQSMPPAPLEDADDDLHFDWSKQDVNLIVGSFYFGYMPGILFSGDLAQRYGAKYLLLFCLLGSALTNLATPAIARFSLNLLISSRIFLGLIQGTLVPALYELFNRWLTQTESSIFAPMLKVSMPLGSLIGTLMPGLLARYQLAWPNLFYMGGIACACWSLVWLLVATSRPQTNRFVEQDELNRIMRKKSAAFKMVEIPPRAPFNSSDADGIKRRSSASCDADICAGHQTMPSKPVKLPPLQAPSKARATPWLKIATNPSVLALTLVKFTYNIGMDFIFLQLAVYLREVHSASIETISAIASSSYLVQMLLITFVGWLAKALVFRRALGLSVTKWRKLFQGGSNLLMALAYVALAYLEPGIEVATILILAVALAWMLGAGGESMVPYDLSSRFPASIMGFAHSVSICSGIALTALFGLVLGEQASDPSRWSLLFLILAALLAFGGLVFVCVLKAKPFLPGEKQTSKQQERQANSRSATHAASAKEREAANETF